jgi:hypothetical protein
MKDWLIKFLKARTNEEYLLLNAEYNAQREFTSLYRARVDSLEAQVLAERAERRFLQDLIFKRFGVTISEDSPAVQEENLKPIGTSPQRWSSLRGRLEKDDRQRVTGVHTEERTA